MSFTLAVDLQDIHNVVNFVLLLHSFSVVLNTKVYAKCLNLNENVPQIMGFNVGNDNASGRYLI